MLYCNNGSVGFHTHPTPEEAARCWGTPALYVVGGNIPTPTPALAAAMTWAPPPPPRPKPRWWDDPSTGSQHWRVEKEGGSVKRAKAFSKGECREYIDALMTGRAPKELDPVVIEDDDEQDEVVTPPPSRSHVTRVHGYRVAKDTTFVMTPLLERVPDGRFAVQMDANDEPVFLRVVRPKAGQWKNCLKVQTQHGDRYEDAWCKWDDDKIGVFKASVEDYINLLIADYRGAARLYSKIKTKCARCNTDLTDERSRHYGIGPECEKYWPWMIQQVDEETALANGE